MADDRARVAEELRKIREGVREQALLKQDAVLPDARPLPEGGAMPSQVARPEAPVPPAPPDAAAINALWNVAQAPASGLLAGLVRRLLAPFVEAQVAFNARQVQLDNEMLAYLNARFEATHRHYDAILGGYGAHQGDADKRHLILQEEVVAHVHDLVRRIDLVLAKGEKDRISAEFALRDLRTRLERLEQRLLAEGERDRTA